MDLATTRLARFRYDKLALEHRELEFRLNSERLAGSFDALPVASQEDATIDLMLSEAIKTSAIEGEDLDRESVRSSLLSLITSDTLPDNSDQKAAGAASLLVDVRKNWQASLTHDLLGKWQSMAVPEQRHTSIMRGEYRNDPAPMQIVSGPYGREKIHYEARTRIRRYPGLPEQGSPISGSKCSIPLMMGMDESAGRLLTMRFRSLSAIRPRLVLPQR